MRKISRRLAAQCALTDHFTRNAAGDFFRRYGPDGRANGCVDTAYRIFRRARLPQVRIHRHMADGGCTLQPRSGS